MTTVAVQLTVNVTDENRLRAYTSGFMPATATCAARVAALFRQGGHIVQDEICGAHIEQAQTVTNPPPPLVGFPEPDDLDPGVTCPNCGLLLWQDYEGDWNHVILDNDELPIALQTVCNREV